MRKFILFLAVLAVVSTAAFLLTYTFGRKPSLEQELVRRGNGGGEGDEGLRIVSIAAEGDDDGAPSAEGEGVLQEERGGVVVSRIPASGSGLMLLVDGALLAREGGGYREALLSLTAGLPAGVEVGVRALASGEEGACDSSTLVREPAPADAGDVKSALLSASALGGPRSLQEGLQKAAADLGGKAGGRHVLLIASGGDECDGDPCLAATRLLAEQKGLRLTALLVGDGEEEDGAPGGGLECLARMRGGTVLRAASPREAKGKLEELAGQMQPNLVVRVYHAEGREVTGGNAERRAAWGLRLARAGRGGDDAKRTFAFPASFTLDPGRYDLLVWYQGRERRIKGLELGPGERVEAAANFHSGELYVRARDASGEEMVGETSDFDCHWGVEIFRAGNMETAAGSTCAFPSYFVLKPGTYTVRAWMGGADVWLDDVAVAEGQTTMKSVAFPEEAEPPPPSP